MVLERDVSDYRALITLHTRSDTTAGGFDWDTGRSGANNTKLDGGQDGLERRVSMLTATNGFSPIVAGAGLASAGASWTDASKTITNTGAFAAYTFTAGDVMWVGYSFNPLSTNFARGFYTISSKTSNDAVVLATDINGASGDIASGISFVVYRPSHTSITYTAVGNVLTTTGNGFSTYHWQHLDRVVVVAGTSVTKGTYYVRSKTDDNTLVLTAAAGGVAASADNILGSGNQSDLSIILYKQESIAAAYIRDGAFQDGGELRFKLSGQWNGYSGTDGFNQTYTAATWTQASLTLTKTGAFTNYTFAVGDYVYITSGTGTRAGLYPIGSRTDADNITLMGTVGAAANGQTDLAFKIIKAVSIYFKLWCANPDGSSPTVVLTGSAGTNANAWVVPYVPTATGLGGTAGTFDVEMSVLPTAGQEQGTGANVRCEGIFNFDYSATANWTGEGSKAFSACYRSGIQFTGDKIWYMSYAKTAGENYVCSLNPKHYSVYHIGHSTRATGGL